MGWTLSECGDIPSQFTKYVSSIKIEVRDAQWGGMYLALLCNQYFMDNADSNSEIYFWNSGNEYRAWIKAIVTSSKRET